MKATAVIMTPATIRKQHALAVTRGRLGGQANTKAQNKARAANALHAGRPRRVCTTCGAPVLGGGVHKAKALDLVCAGRDWAWQKRSEQV